MNDPNSFSELNIPRLTIAINRLIKGYPCVEEVRLYPGREKMSFTLFFFLSEPVLTTWGQAGRNKGQMYGCWPGEDESALEFRNFMDSPDFINALEMELEEVYKKTPPTGYIHNWLSLLVDPEEDVPLEFTGCLEGKKLSEDNFFVLYPREQGIPHEQGQDKADLENIDRFIRSLRVSYQNNSQIKIREPGKSPVICDCTSMGFRDDNTKEWRVFCDIIEHPPHSYSLGDAYKYSYATRKKKKSQKYNRRDDRLKKISAKLVAFFNKEFGKQIPKNYRMYEPYPEGGKGVRKFKFQIDDQEDQQALATEKIFDRYSKDQLLDKIGKLAKESEGEEKLEIALLVAIRKKYLTEEEGLSYLKEKVAYHEYAPEEAHDEAELLQQGLRITE